MRSLAELLHPVTLEAFQADYDDRKPLHIRHSQTPDAGAILDWARFNALLGQASIWTPDNLKLVFNGEPIPPGQYCVEVKTPLGPRQRPSPAKIQPLLSMGASLIADDAQSLTPDFLKLSSDLSRHFAGLVGANIYCSFGGVQAFNTHFDLHHVFAIQVEGKKTWRIYENRMADAVDFPVEGPDAKRWFAQTRGPLMSEITMCPGDVLYLPRGCYHDAMTTEGASLHVTFSVTPLYGRIIFKLLEAAAMQDPAFRAWLRPAGEGDGKLLGQQLSDLGQRLAALTRSDTFREEIAMTQEQLTPRQASYDLPNRLILTTFQPTGLQAPAIKGPAAIAMQWAMTQPRVSLEDMVAQFDFVPEADIVAAVEAAVAVGALRRL